MSVSLRAKSVLAMSVSVAAIIAAASPASAAAAAATEASPATTTIGELVVTAERKEESLQSVPIAVSAFSGDALKQQRLETGSDLLLSVPNVTFSRGNFGGYNFQIRGIGTKLVATSADAAIGIHENNVPLTANTLADAEFYDVQRVEVLRGPQGTQFGRNTTGGLVNMITNMPTHRYEASITGEYGNYNTGRVNGFVNVPLGDQLAVRAAGSFVTRDGFGKNDITGNRIDGRNLYSTRVTVAWDPGDRFNAHLMWEHFNEDDNRDRVGKQLCIKDPGRTSIGGVATNLAGANTVNTYSQGCLPGDLHSAAALQEVNSAATLGGGLGNLTGLITGDAYAGKIQDPNLRNIESAFDPIYRNRFDTVQLFASYKVTDNVTLTSTTSWSYNKAFTEADYNRATPTQNFNGNVPNICALLGCPVSLVTDANGFFDDPQVGRTNQFRTIDFSDAKSQQWTQEFHLSSSFEGPFNFSLGATYLHFKTTSNYYVTSNTLTAATESIFNPLAGCPALGTKTAPCEYVDPSAIPDGSGHNYFDSRTHYSLSSYAAFGEVYYQLTPDLKVTGGLRYTEDKKQVLAPSPGLFTAGSGPGAAIAGLQRVTFKEVTGRANIDWTPHLSFTDKTLVYASYARGYKGGGFNPPQSPTQHLFPDTYEPEFIDAFEVGTKNTLMGGSLVLNATGFYYNYKNYQVSEIIQRTSVNVNINAKVYGAELESIWQPVNHLRLNANIGYLHTKLDNTESIDLTNLTQGDPNYAVLKNGLTYSDCIAPVSQLAALQAKVNAGIVNPTFVAGNSGLVGLAPGAAGVCNNAFATGSTAALLYGVAVDPISPGKPAQLGGNQLPNSPHWTVSLGAQYDWDVNDKWRLTPRVDFYYQTSSFARIFNTVSDRLDSYTNTNLSLTATNQDWGLNVQLYVKNVFNKTVVTDQYITDDTSGLFTNIFLTEPRTYGVSVTKHF